MVWAQEGVPRAQGGLKIRQVCHASCLHTTFPCYELQSLAFLESMLSGKALITVILRFLVLSSMSILVDIVVFIS
jgi:hypothetical protein